MASIDIGKLVQESVMATSIDSGEDKQVAQTSAEIDVKRLDEVLMSKVQEASNLPVPSTGTTGTALQALPSKKKKISGKAIAAGAAGLAAGAGAIKGAMAYKDSKNQSHAEALRQTAKEKLASAQDKAGSMGSTLKSMGTAAMDKIKENPKAAAGIAAGTAGAIGAGLAAKKLMAMRKAKKAA